MMFEQFEHWLDEIRRKLNEMRSREACAEFRLQSIDDLYHELRYMIRVGHTISRAIVRRVFVPLGYLCVLLSLGMGEHGPLVTWFGLTTLMVAATAFFKWMLDNFDDDNPIARSPVPVEVAYPIAYSDPFDGDRSIDQPGPKPRAGMR